jgi:pyruvate formate lyase activating enzyme
VLSWTYNDPVVWHEFVRDTAKLGREAGLINLYKSAFYITTEAVDELLPYMDIFSISIKSIDPDYYRKFTKGTLQPVLDATKHVHRAGKHVEVSTLMITDISDNDKTARDVTEWVLTELDATVPMHFVRFHPDYRMRDTIRTPIPRLLRAREVAIGMGAEHVYLGNVYDTPFSNTTCNGCGELLVTRYGLNAAAVGLDANGRCSRCGRDAHVKRLPAGNPVPTRVEIPDDVDRRTYDWQGDIRSLHVQVLNTNDRPVEVYVRRLVSSGEPTPWRVRTLVPGESYRFIVAKSQPDEVGCDVGLAPGVQSNLHEVFDRAHFPTLAVEEVGRAETDVYPLPLFGGV